MPIAAAADRRGKSELAACLGDKLRIDWYETAGEKWKIARLGGLATDIRLRAPETFVIHKQVIDWTRPFSPDGLPAGTLGLSKTVLPLMRWAMADWGRMHRLNRWLGTWSTRAQLDYAPGLRSGAFFTIRLLEPLSTPDPVAPDPLPLIRSPLIRSPLIRSPLTRLPATWLAGRHGSSGYYEPGRLCNGSG